MVAVHGDRLPKPYTPRGNRKVNQDSEETLRARTQERSGRRTVIIILRNITKTRRREKRRNRVTAAGYSIRFMLLIFLMLYVQHYYANTDGIGNGGVVFSEAFEGPARDWLQVTGANRNPTECESCQWREPLLRT